MEELHQQLYRVQATLFHLFQKTWVYHWNVVGSDFYQLHSLFSDQYTAMVDEVDRIAEHIRAYEVKALGPLSQILSESELSDVDMTATSMQMVSILLADNIRLKEILREASDKADELDQPHTSNMLQEMMEQHAKFAWMLRSMLKTV